MCMIVANVDHTHEKQIRTKQRSNTNFQKKDAVFAFKRIFLIFDAFQRIAFLF
jgi:hypothetical protein